MLSRNLVPASQLLHEPPCPADPAHISGLDDSLTPQLRVLLVQPDSALRAECAATAADLGYEPVVASTAEAGRRMFFQNAADVLLLDLHLPDGASVELLADIRERRPETAVIVTTAFATVSSAVDAMRLGACDYLTSPFTSEELGDVLRRASRRVHVDLQSRLLRERLRTDKGMGQMIGRTPEMEKIYRIVSKVAFATHPVLILGESGTGKELVARSIHANGPDPSRPFVAVDLSAINATLMEGELFGHINGASLGANCSRQGLLCAAEGGTVFLDEVGGLSLELQSRLVRALQDRQLYPVGATEPVPFSARILASSSRDLLGMVSQGRFRRDLFFRLNVVNIKLPPLRERRDDIRMLAEYLLEREEAQTGLSHTLSVDSVRALSQYDWPGNVRELEHALERACALSSGPTLHMADLPTQLHDFRMHTPAQASNALESRGGSILSIADRERHAILDAIRQFRGDKVMAARVLGIGKTTLYRKLKEYNIPAAEINRA